MVGESAGVALAGVALQVPFAGSKIAAALLGCCCHDSPFPFIMELSTWVSSIGSEPTWVGRSAQRRTSRVTGWSKTGVNCGATTEPPDLSQARCRADSRRCRPSALLGPQSPTLIAALLGHLSERDHAFSLN